MENKIRNPDLFVFLVSFLSPPDRAKARLSHVSKTFRAACNRPSLMAADIKYASDTMEKTAQITEFSRKKLDYFTDQGYIAFYWLVIARLHNTCFKDAWRPLWESFSSGFMFGNTAPLITRGVGQLGILAEIATKYKKGLCLQMILDVLMGVRGEDEKPSCSICCYPASAPTMRRCPTRLCKDCMTLARAGDAKTLRKMACGFGLRLEDYYTVEDSEQWTVDAWEKLLAQCIEVNGHVRPSA
jgi:hypothetical protein